MWLFCPRGNALGEDGWRVFRRDVTISFKPVKLNWSQYGTCSEKQWMCTLHMNMLYCLYLDRWWVITPSEFAFMLRIFFKIWIYQQNWEANWSCSYFETSSDSFSFLVRLLTNFGALVHLNYVSKRRFFLIFGLKTLCLINIKQNTSNRGRVNPTVLHHWPSTDFREALSAGFFATGHLLDRLWRFLLEVGYHTNVRGFHGTMQVPLQSLSRPSVPHVDLKKPLIIYPGGLLLISPQWWNTQRILGYDSAED